MINVDKFLFELDMHNVEYNIMNESELSVIPHAYIPCITHRHDFEHYKKYHHFLNHRAERCEPSMRIYIKDTDIYIFIDQIEIFNATNIYTAYFHKKQFDILFNEGSEPGWDDEINIIYHLYGEDTHEVFYR